MDETRRQFLKQVARRSMIATGLTVATAALVKTDPSAQRAWNYVKPKVKNFMPETTVYAQTTGAGTFTLKGTT